MQQLSQIEDDPLVSPAQGTCAPVMDSGTAWLQILTLGWMSVECVGAIVAASRAHSVALLAFGSDSLVELFSGGVVILQFSSVFRMSRDTAARFAGALLFVLAAAIGLIAIAATVIKAPAEHSTLGIGITSMALLLMPGLAWLKRRKARQTNDRALAADAVQSATCAYLAAITLASLALQIFFPLRWIDSVAALCAIPILVVEARRARRDESCGCC